MSGPLSRGWSSQRSPPSKQITKEHFGNNDNFKKRPLLISSSPTPPPPSPKTCQFLGYAQVSEWILTIDGSIPGLLCFQDAQTVLQGKSRSWEELLKLLLLCHINWWSTCELSLRSYFTVTPMLMVELDFSDLWSCARSPLHFHGYRGLPGWFLRSTALTGFQSAVKTNPLINPIDQSKNRGKCDLHTQSMINALNDFSFFQNQISSLFKVRQRVQANADRCWVVPTRIQSILLCTKG